ncbi:glycosyltransferase family 2 protein [Aeromonas allosaccharophila]|uniref:glycosyltransferase family 2 protein n=1 Tax=Aeromonas allosaccharophila TaxID=656 RepID=UPI003D1FEC33
MITIFTPTFNRASYLKVCYEGLLNQTYNDFEWLIVDDGSDDNTKEVVEEFLLEGKIKIRYLYQENAGKQAAWNTGVLNSNGEYFIGVDSDDSLTFDGLRVFFDNYIPMLASNKDIIGVRALSMKQSTQYADNAYSIDMDSSVDSWFNEFASGISGERIDIFKTSMLKEFLYPVKGEIRFIPEIWFYVNVSRKYKFLYVSKYLRLFYDEHDGNRLSRSAIEKHAKGHFIARSAMLKYIPVVCFLKNPIALVKTCIRWCQCLFFIIKNR